MKRSIKNYSPLFLKTAMFIACLFSMAETYAADFVSNSNGNWDIGATWGNPGNNVEGSGYPGPLDNATITNGKTVAVKNSESISNITINGGGILANSNNKTLIVLGNYTLNGTHTGGTGSKVTFAGTNKFITGIGTLSMPGGIFILTDRSISASAVLTIASDVNLTLSVTLTNNGDVTIVSPYSVTSALVGPTWVNAANSTLNPGGAVNVLNNITLVASATGNTVNYYQESSQNIKIPSGNTYYNLHLTGVGTKSLIGNITAEGNVYIESATLNTATYNLTVKGNWENEGDITGTGTVIFSGTNVQSISNSVGEIFYNMTVSKTGGSLVLENDAAVSNMLTMTSGLINANLHTLSLGTSTSSIGSLSYAGGLLYNGKFRRWVNATGVNYLFPLGVEYGFYTPLKINFNNLSVSGSIEAEFIPLSSGNNGVPLVDGAETVYNTFGTGYYTLTPLNGLASTNYNLELNGLPMFTIEPSTRILTRTDASSNWIANGVHADADVPSQTAKRNNLTILPAHYVLGDVTNCTVPTTSATSGSANVCINATENYSVTNTPGNLYTWFVTGGTQSAGGNGSSISIDWGSTGTTGLIVVAETNACGTGLPVLTYVTISPTSITSITGKEYAPENTSPGNEETYSVPLVPGYTYAWSISGGTIISGSATNSVEVRWGAAGSGSISVGVTNSCGTTNVIKPITIYVVINSIRSGSWGTASTWDCNCVPASYNSVRVKNPHTVTFPNSNLTIANLISDIGGTYNNTTNKTLTVTGDILINGEYKGTNELILSGSGEVDGIGVISTSGNLTLTAGSKTILSSAVLSRTNGPVNIASGIHVNNRGIFSVAGNIVGASSSSQWTNEAYSTLNIGGTLLSTGTLVVNTVPNAVEYTGSSSQNIVLTDYYDLYSSGTGARVLPGSGIVGIAGSFDPGTNSFTVTGSTIDFNGASAQEIPEFTFNHFKATNGSEKTLTGAVVCNGNLSIESGTTLNLDGYSLSVKGNFANSGNFLHNVGSTTFNGNSLQTITGATTFYDFTLNNTAGLTLNSAINIDNDLSVSAGALGFGTTAKNVTVIGNVSGAGAIAMTGSGLAHHLILEGATNSIGTFTTTTGSGSTVSYTLAGDQTMIAGTYQNLITEGSGTKTFTANSSAEGNLTIGSGLILDDAGFTVTIKGNITNDGTHIGTGKILLSGGSAAHGISGGTFTNLELNDGQGASINSASVVQGVLTLSAGTMASSGNLTINLNTGAIAGTGTGAISGNMNVYKTPAASTYHYISAPLNGITAAALNDDVNITNRLYYYNESIVSADKAVGWTKITSTSTNIDIMKGYALYFTAPSISVDMTGTYAHTSAPSNITLTHTVSALEASDGWNLVGNPYPSALDWDAASGWTRTNIDGAIYYWDPLNNRYASYVTGSGTNGGTRYVPSMQGFFLKVSTPGVSGTLGMNNNVRVTSANPSVWRTAYTSNILRLTASSGLYADETVIRLRDDASVSFDSQVDAYKMKNTGSNPSLYTSLDKKDFSINSLPDSAKNMTIPLKLKAAFTGTYTIKAEEEGIFDEDFSILLEDKLLGITQDLKLNSSYTFNFTEGDTSTRFYINLRKAEVTGIKEAASANVQIWSDDNTVTINFENPSSNQATISVFNLSGKEIVNREEVGTNDQIKMTFPAETSPGIYMVKIHMNGMVYCGKVSYLK